MAIEIYSFTPVASSTIISEPFSKKLVAVASLEQREQVEVWCSERNKEAAEAGVARRFKYSVTAVEIWPVQRVAPPAVLRDRRRNACRDIVDRLQEQPRK